MKTIFIRSILIVMVLFGKSLGGTSCLAQENTPIEDSVSVQSIFDVIVSNLMCDFLESKNLLSPKLAEKRDSIECVKAYIRKNYDSESSTANQLLRRFLDKKKEYKTNTDGREFIKSALNELEIEFSHDTDKVERLVLSLKEKKQKEISTEDPVGFSKNVTNTYVPPPVSTKERWLENILFLLLGILLMFIYWRFQQKENRVNPTMISTSPIKSELWTVLHTSEIGKSHLKATPQIPCQDSHAVKHLNDGWGIAVVCDGAGSAKHSDKGSSFVAKEAVQLFAHIIEENKWIEQEVLPPEIGWKKLCFKALQKLCYDLQEHAKEIEVNFKDLACTIIVLIYTPKGILYTHIGDGRAGYRTSNGEWKGLINPHKGEEDNHTIFLTTSAWWKGDLEMKGIEVPQSGVIANTSTAFTLMSDGCEQHVFEIGYFDEKQKKVIPKNTPYKKLFESLITQIVSLEKEGKSFAQVQEKWSKFVKEGTVGLKNELDDKTLIIGLRNER